MPPTSPLLPAAHVDPGGVAVAWVVPDAGDAGVEVRKRSVGRLDNAVYVLRDLATDDALLVDAADDADLVLEAVEGLAVRAVVTTHGHPDHWQALGAVVAATGGSPLAHPADADLIPHRTDAVEDGGRVHFGTAEVRVLHTPGHTPGSVCLLLADRVLLSGDTLFPGGPGATRGDAAAFRTLIGSLRERLFVLDDATLVCPGHGDGTTIGAERPSLDDWAARGW